MVDRTQARELVEAAEVAGGDIRITPIAGGTINQAFRLESDDGPPMVLRIAPSDADAAAGPSWLTSHGLLREQEVLRLLADLGDVLPRTVHFDDSRTLIDRDWVVQTVVRGQPWNQLRARLDDREQRVLWRELGELTARIHAVEGEEFGPPAGWHGIRMWSEMMRWDATGFAVDADRYELDPEPFRMLCTIIDRAVPVLDRISRPRLIHSDLGLHHVFTERGQDGLHHVTGLIDFEFGRFADPMSESAFVVHELTPAADEDFVAFCAGYGRPPHGHDDEVRCLIYQMVALGWQATDLVRRGHRDEVRTVLGTLGDLGRKLEHMV
jgi:hypothetical protein